MDLIAVKMMTLFTEEALRGHFYWLMSPAVLSLTPHTSGHPTCSSRSDAPPFGSSDSTWLTIYF